MFGSLTNTFAQFFLGDPSVIAAFKHEISEKALYFVYIAIAVFTTVYISMVGFIYTGEHITQKLREHYLAAVLRQNIAFFDKLGAGEITTRITSDMVDIQAGISEKVGLTLTGISTFVGALVVGFVKDWRLTLILFSIVVSMVSAMAMWSKLMVKYQKESQLYSGTGATLAEEVFSSIRNATALGTQDRLATEYDGYLLKAEKGGMKMKSVLGMMLGTMYFISKLTPLRANQASNVQANSFSVLQLCSIILARIEILGQRRRQRWCNHYGSLRYGHGFCSIGSSRSSSQSIRCRYRSWRTDLQSNRSTIFSRTGNQNRNITFCKRRYRT